MLNYIWLEQKPMVLFINKYRSAAWLNYQREDCDGTVALTLLCSLIISVLEKEIMFKNKINNSRPLLVKFFDFLATLTKFLDG